VRVRVDRGYGEDEGQSQISGQDQGRSMIRVKVMQILKMGLLASLKYAMRWHEKMEQ